MVGVALVAADQWWWFGGVAVGWCGRVGVGVAWFAAVFGGWLVRGLVGGAIRATRSGYAVSLGVQLILRV